MSTPLVHGALDVLVIDEEKTFAESLAMALTSRSFGAWQVRAATPVEVLHPSGEAPPAPHTVLMSSKGRGRQLLAQLTTQHPEAAVVVLLVSRDETALPALVLAGARGWACTSDSLDHVDRVLREVSAGGWWLPRWAVGEALQELRRAADDGLTARFASLTPRERQVLAGLVEGSSRAAIARRHEMSINTVRTHIQHLFEKLGVHSCLEAVVLTQARRGGSTDL
ncbi:MAG: transcriptional regulator [Frankiales bacterium]|nr:transcriptional regulator [Frankiales bacterium]